MHLNPHTLAAYDEALYRLREQVLTMASVIEQSLHLALEGLFQRRQDICEKVEEQDEQVDHFEKRIDQAGIELIVRYRPVASDLRHVLGAMKLGSHLERIGDLAVSIARKASRLNELPRNSEIHLLESLATEVLALLQDSLRAFSDHNSDAALAIKPRDKAVDGLKKETCRRLTERMSNDPGQIECYLSLIFVARHLERIGDYAKSIAESTVFVEAAQDIRHVKRERES